MDGEMDRGAAGGTSQGVGGWVAPGRAEGCVHVSRGSDLLVSKCLTCSSLTRATALPVYFSFLAEQHQHSFSTAALEASLGVLQDRAGRGERSTVWGSGSPVSLAHVGPELTLGEVTTPRAQSLQQGAALPSLP